MYRCTKYRTLLVLNNHSHKYHMVKRAQLLLPLLLSLLLYCFIYIYQIEGTFF